MSAPATSGEPTAKECAAAIIHIAVVLRDYFAALGDANTAQRINHAIVEPDCHDRKDRLDE